MVPGRTIPRAGPAPAPPAGPAHPFIYVGNGKQMTIKGNLAGNDRFDAGETPQAGFELPPRSPPFLFFFYILFLSSAYLLLVFYTFHVSSARLPVVFYPSSTAFLFLRPKRTSLLRASISRLIMRFFSARPRPQTPTPVKYKNSSKSTTLTPATPYHPFPTKNTIPKFDFFKICGIFNIGYLRAES